MLKHLNDWHAGQTCGSYESSKTSCTSRAVVALCSSLAGSTCDSITTRRSYNKAFQRQLKQYKYRNKCYQCLLTSNWNEWVLNTPTHTNRIISSNKGWPKKWETRRFVYYKPCIFHQRHRIVGKVVRSFKQNVAVWLSGSTLVSINEVTLRWPRLVMGWVTSPGFSSRCRKPISVYKQLPRST